MDARKLLTTVGTGVTSFLVVAVLVIELLDFEFSAIVGLPAGLLVGVAVAVGVWIRGNELSLGVRRIVAAYAAFGIAVLLLFTFRYANIGRSVLTFEVIVGGSLATAVLVYIALILLDRTQS